MTLPRELSRALPSTIYFLQRYVLSPQDPIGRLSRKQRYYIKDLPRTDERQNKRPAGRAWIAQAGRGVCSPLEFNETASARHFLQDQVKAFDIDEVIVERNKRRF